MKTLTNYITIGIIALSFVGVVFAGNLMTLRSAHAKHTAPLLRLHKPHSHLNRFGYRYAQDDAK